uniref:Uncharacterized protein n=1 Tax=Candidatus Kentrum sp. SD TaxID=2126332 RepID=A0A451BJ48_9GAMM|nr:MAG: hypothetical protein BECKSD772D_GA0070982_101036 [Candidatus Kentron sp. SD]
MGGHDASEWLVTMVWNERSRCVGIRKRRHLAQHRGRNVIPPGVTLPGPFNTLCYQSALATYPFGSSNAFCTGTNPHRYDLAFLKPHSL